MFDNLYYVVDYRIYNNKSAASIIFKLKNFFENTEEVFYARQELGYYGGSVDPEVICIKDNKLTFCYDIIGKVISIDIWDEQQKIKIINVYAYDVFRHIYKLLKENRETSFDVLYPLYKILKKLGRKQNSDGSFTLKGEFSHYNVNHNNICYINTISDRHINFENIILIYEKFYKDNYSEGNHWSREYSLTNGFAIIESVWRETKLSYAGRTDSTILRRVGDELSIEEKLFLNNYNKIKD